jgi:hypothetical protein
MDPLMIYILDEKIPTAQLKEQLEKTQPLTKEEVVDLIISKIDGYDETNFMSFEKRYTKSSFLGQSNQVKYDAYLKDLENLENLYENLGTWNDPNELRSDLITNLISFHIVDEKTVLYNYQLEDWTKTASGYHLLCKKKEYLEHAVKVQQNLIIGKIEFSNPTSENITNGQQQKNTEKKVPEKWYALLHMIYVNMKKEIPFEKKTSKDELKTFGRENYPFEGTGHCFYMAIQQIRNKGLNNYIFGLTKSDFRKWKKTVIKISGNDQEIELWIDNNKY